MRVYRYRVLALTALLALTACERPPQQDDQTTGSVTGEDMEEARADWPALASTMVDSANASYRAKDLQAALRQYEAALAAADDSKSAKVTSYFGIYMVQNALGDTIAAAAAMQRAQELAPEASLIHGGMPMGTTPAAPQDSIHRGVGK